MLTQNQWSFLQKTCRAQLGSRCACIEQQPHKHGIVLLKRPAANLTKPLAGRRKPDCDCFELSLQQEGMLPPTPQAKSVLAKQHGDAKVKASTCHFARMS